MSITLKKRLQTAVILMLKAENTWLKQQGIVYNVLAPCIFYQSILSELYKYVCEQQIMRQCWTLLVSLVGNTVQEKVFTSRLHLSTSAGSLQLVISRRWYGQILGGSLEWGAIMLGSERRRCGEYDGTQPRPPVYVDDETSSGPCHHTVTIQPSVESITCDRN